MSTGEVQGLLYLLAADNLNQPQFSPSYWAEDVQQAQFPQSSNLFNHIAQCNEDCWLSTKRQKRVRSFSWRSSHLQAVTVGAVLSLLRVQTWCDFTAPLVHKMRGMWRQVSWGHLSKHGKCSPDNSWELQPSPAELSLPALGEAFCALLLPRPFRWHPAGGKGSALEPGWHKLQPFHFRERPQHGHLQCSLCPISAQIPGLQSWRGVVVGPGFRKPTAKGTFRGWLQKGSPTICWYWLWPFTGLLGRDWKGKCPLEGGIWWRCPLECGIWWICQSN